VEASKIRLGHFTETCQHWIEYFDPDNKDFVRFRDILDITADEFLDIMTERRPIYELVRQLKHRIESLEEHCDWEGLIEMWEYFSLGPDIAMYAPYLIEEFIQNGDALQAMKTAIRCGVGDEVLKATFSEYQRYLRRNIHGQLTPERTLIYNSGIFPAGPGSVI